MAKALPSDLWEGWIRDPLAKASLSDSCLFPSLLALPSALWEGWIIDPLTMVSLPVDSLISGIAFGLPREGTMNGPLTLSDRALFSTPCAYHCIANSLTQTCVCTGPGPGCSLRLSGMTSCVSNLEVYSGDSIRFLQEGLCVTWLKRATECL